MPKAEMPRHALGWLVALGSSMVGFLAGLLFLKLANWTLGNG